MKTFTMINHASNYNSIYTKVIDNLTFYIKLFIVSLLLTLGSNLSAQFDIVQIENDLHQRAADMAATQDGNYAVLTYSESEPGTPNADLIVYKVTPEGSLIWQSDIIHEGIELNGSHKYPDIIGLADGGFAILYTREDNPDPDTEFALLIRLNSNGNELWREEFECCFHDLLENEDGELWIVGRSREEATANDFWLQKLDANGAVIFSQTYFYEEGGLNGPEEGFHLSINANGETIISGQRNVGQSDIVHLRIDENGEYISGIEFGHPEVISTFSEYAHTPDGGTIYLTSYTNDVYYMAKVDTQGQLVWEISHSAGAGIRVYNDMIPWNGGAVGVGYFQPQDASTTVDGMITFWDANGNIVNDIRVNIDSGIEELVSVVPSPDGDLQFLGRLFDASAGPAQVNPFTFGADEFGNIFSSSIIGQTFLDENMDCIFDENESILGGHTITLEGAEYYTTPLNSGSFSFSVPPGTYTLDATTLSHYWGGCEEAVEVTVAAGETVEVDFGANPIVDCPLMEVNHISGSPRICTAVDYVFQYCNIGTAIGENIYVEVTIDEALEVTDSSIPYTEDMGIYTFQLPDTEVSECGDFSVEMYLSCDTELGAAICTEAHIYPDSLCIEDGLWSGASIALQAECDGTNVNFSLQNVGTSTSSALDFIIIEDQVVLNVGTIELEPNEIELVLIPANSSTITMIAEQEPFHPGFSMPMASVENCDGMGGSGYVTMFPPDDNDFFIDILCQEALNSYDPNAKAAYPKGIGEDHIISPNTDIEYTIYFQNTGNDVAYHVRLSDMISEHLDPTSIRPGASSHVYDWSLTGEGHLQFFFDDINLPDSTSNEAESQGWVNYRISQRPSLPDGTLIENTAGIYFDFNEPIITNTTFHNVGRTYTIVPVKNEEIEANISVMIAPNPFVDRTTLSIDNEDFNGGELSVYDLNGKVLKQIPFIGNSQEVYLPNLNSGMYFLELTSEREVWWTGKIVRTH